MGMQTDVKGATCPVSTDTTAYSGRTRFKGLWYSATGASTIVIKDGETTLFTFTIGAAGVASIWVPGEGVLCTTSLVVSVGATCAAVAFYG